MPVALPQPEAEHLEPPDPTEVTHIVRGLATAPAPSTGLTDVQRAVVEELTESLTGVRVDTRNLEPISPEDYAAGLSSRNAAFRGRCVQIMLLAGLILVPLPEDVAERLEAFARELSVDERTQELIRATRHLARGSMGLALMDFERSGYLEDVAERASEAVHTKRDLTDAWQLAPNDDELFARWAALERCPEGTLGHGVWRFYRARDFAYPGCPDAVPPLLAQHDWVHVLADYGSTVESEIEVFGFIARANDDPQAIALLAMVLSLFETGYAHGMAAFFEYDRGHLSSDARSMAARLGDAMLRGTMVATRINRNLELRDGTGEPARVGERYDPELPEHTDLLAVDWFRYADWPLDELRERFGLPQKAAKAIDAGSVGPWQRGGISPFQYERGRAAAERDQRSYDSYGAEPIAAPDR
jgi:hypothetical protein